MPHLINSDIIYLNSRILHSYSNYIIILGWNAKKVAVGGGDINVVMT